MNGIGERAGNCSLEEVVMALRTRHDFFGLRTGIRTQQLCSASRVVAGATGFHVAAQQGSGRPERVRARVRDPQHGISTTRRRTR